MEASAEIYSVDRCSHCGKAGVELKRCMRCKEASYCGAACQKVDWTRHKKTCAPPLPRSELIEKLWEAHSERDWRGILKWQGRMEELIAGRTDASCAYILEIFSIAHKRALNSTGSKEQHARSCVGLQQRRIPILLKLQRFRDQGEAMCDIAFMFDLLKKEREAASYFQQARDVGAAHGFFSLESKVCLGLGRSAATEGRHEEGVALMHNALAAARLNELDDPAYEIHALTSLIDMLFKAGAIDEVEPGPNPEPRTTPYTLKPPQNLHPKP
jgi:hypothetical protein